MDKYDDSNPNAIAPAGCDRIIQFRHFWQIEVFLFYRAYDIPSYTLEVDELSDLSQLAEIIGELCPEVLAIDRIVITPEVREAR
jgi:hypothetical protein